MTMKAKKGEKKANKTPNLEEPEGIETIRHSKEKMGESRLKIEALPHKAWMPICSLVWRGSLTEFRGCEWIAMSICMN